MHSCVFYAKNDVINQWEQYDVSDAEAEHCRTMQQMGLRGAKASRCCEMSKTETAAHTRCDVEQHETAFSDA